VQAGDTLKDGADDTILRRIATLVYLDAEGFGEHDPRAQLTLRIDVALSLDDISPLMATLVEQGITVETLNSEMPNLETTFLALTGRELR
jgi:hypothetical protein